MRRDIEFNAEGLTLRGWFYVPDGAKKSVPTIVMAHGFSCTKEMFLDKYAEVFVKDGFAVLVYDNRNFGDSDGQPRLEVDPTTRSATTGTRSHMSAACPRSTAVVSASGASATPAGMCCR